jgi:hypothetical protein
MFFKSGPRRHQILLAFEAYRLPIRLSNAFAINQIIGA